MSRSRRGALIVFEGLDRSGKSTQCQLLMDALKILGYPCETMKFPERSTVIGSVISSYLQKKFETTDEAIHLLFSANRWEAVPEMKSKLSEGVSLIIDRYAFSGVAYSSAKDSLSLNWCKNSDVGLPKPDLVLFIDSELGISRSGYGDERYEYPEFQKLVKQNYEKLYDPAYWTRINGSSTIEDVHNEIMAVIQEKIINQCPQNLQKLWTP